MFHSTYITFVQVHSQLLRTQESLSAAEAELKKFTAKVAEVSWDLLTTVPPLVCSQPTRISRRYHHTENWDNSPGSGQELTYFRPVLFSSYEGRVAQKGWVTNRAMGHCTSITGLLSKETGIDSTTPVGIKCRSIRRRQHRREEDKYSEFVVVGNKEQHQMLGVQAALSDLLAGRGEEEREEEGEEGKEGGGVEEALPLLRLTNR